MPRQIGAMRARMEYPPLAALVGTLAAIPLARAVRMGAAMGALAMRLDRPNRSIALKNLEIAFPEKSPRERLGILSAMYRNWGRMAAEWSHFAEFNRGNIGNFAVYDGIEHLNHALRLAERRGALIVTAHFGNWELLQLAHALHGHRLAIVHRPLRNPLIDRQVRAARARVGNASIERKQAGPAMLKYLRDKWHVAVALDLDDRRGVFVDFFGMLASTSDGVARIAMATGAPVVPVFMIREDATTHHKIRVLPVLEMVKTRDREECVRENTQRMVRPIEAAIREHPDHWNWIHRRWKTRPAGEHRFY